MLTMQLFVQLDYYGYTSMAWGKLLTQTVSYVAVESLLCMSGDAGCLPEANLTTVHFFCLSLTA